MRILKSIMTFISIVILLGLLGCGNPNSQPSDQAAIATTDKKEEQVKTYYANTELTGLVKRDAVIQADGQENKYLKTLDLLKKSPDEDAYSLCSNIEFTSAEMNAGHLRLNLHFLDQDRFGTSGEELLVKAIAKTIFQFNEVQTFDVLVDGFQVQTLMGHIELLSPFTRNNHIND